MEDISYEYLGNKDLIQVVKINYKDFTLLTKSQLRGLKINNLIL